MLWHLVSERSEPWSSVSAAAGLSLQLSQTSSSIVLSEPPCILEKPEAMNVLPGAKVQFNVLVSGTPPLITKWFKNKKEISSSADCFVSRDNTSSSLELFFAKAADSGDYVCEIHNDVGSTSCQTTLFVKGCSPSHVHPSVLRDSKPTILWFWPEILILFLLKCILAELTATDSERRRHCSSWSRGCNN